MSIDGHSHQVLQTLKGHTSDVTCCDIAPNFTIITGSSDKTIRIWEWISGSGYVQKSNSPVKAHKYQVTCVRVSPQGSMLASSSVDGTAILWNIHGLAKLYTMTQVNGDAIRVCRFSPDSAILVTAGDNGAVCIWDLVHRSIIRTIFEHEGTTQSLAFTPDSQYLITACSLEFIRVWYVQDLMDTTNDEPCIAVAKIDNAHDMGVFCADFSKHIKIDDVNPLVRHYRLATCGSSNEIKLWSLTSKSVLKHKSQAKHEVALQLFDVLDGHTSSVTCIRYSNSGNHFVSSSLDKLVKIWDNNGDCIATLENHTRYVNCAAISRDSSLVVSGSNDKSVIVTDLTGNLNLESDLNHYRNTLHYSNVISEQQLTENDGYSNKVFLLEKIDDISEGAINSCCFYQKDLLATGSSDKSVRVFQVLEENNALEERTFSPLEGHTYAINHVEFSNNGTMLASCSLDGCTVIWNTTTGQKVMSLPKNILSVKVCRFAPNQESLITAGDDEKPIVWDITKKTKIATLEGHLDTIPSACFTPDGALVVTVCINGDFRVWSTGNFTCLFVKDDAHDLGIQYCDMSENLEPIPNAVTDAQTYLLATCGNDSLVKLWRLTVPKQYEFLQLDRLKVKLWRSFHGHGGNVVCVKFSPSIGEFLCSTATDRQARIWSIYSADCLFVLDHDSIVTSCAFNSDCSLLATGCLDKTLYLWKLPQQMVFQTVIIGKIHCRSKQLIDWSNADVIKWLADIHMQTVIPVAQNTNLDGTKLITLSPETICSGLELDEELTRKLTKEIDWLKNIETKTEGIENSDIPHEFLCPITHEIMREPVICSDGYTYEKNAISEWFISGKSTSPMTNELLTNTDYTFNHDLRNQIYEFIENGTREKLEEEN